MSVEHRLIGVPGSGKTTRLTNIVNELLDSGKYAENELVVASFTRTAALHIASKLSQVGKENVGTLHSLCYRAIQQEGTPFRIAEGELAMWNEYVEREGFSPDWQLERAPTEDDLFDGWTSDRGTGKELLQQINILRAQCVPVEEWQAEHQIFFQAWNNFKCTAGLLDFTDLIEYCIQANTPPPAGVKCGIFDETQDFTTLQMRLLRQWNANFLQEMWLALDDDQCIYGFAGADPRLLVDDLEDTAVERELLGQSYRLPSVIAAHAERQVRRLEHRQAKVIVPLRDGGEVRSVNKDYSQAVQWLPMLEAELAAGRSVMVLASCGYMLKPLTMLLRKHGIPFHNPYRTTTPQWNPLTASNGITAAERLARFAKGPQYWRLQDVSAFVEHLTSGEGKALRRGVKEKIRQTRRVESILAQCVLSFTPEFLPHALAADVGQFLRHIEKSRQTQYAFAEKVLARGGIAALTAPPSLILGTIHSVKGGEADTVFLMPDVSSQAYRLALSSRHHQDTLARQFYVGITRAKDRVYVFQAHKQSRGFWSTQLGGLR